MHSGNILVVDDDELMRGLLRKTLESEGYVVFAATTHTEALHILRAKQMDLILLDRMMPEGDGLDIIERIRLQSSAPIIVVSGKGHWVDKTVGLERGADDYVSKPFEWPELLSRIKAKVRAARRRDDSPERVEKPGPVYLQFDEWTLDSRKLQAFDRTGKSAGLTTLEFRLLEALAAHSGRVMTRDELLDMAGRGDKDVSDRSVDVQIARIRHKVSTRGDLDCFIRTVRGIGYMFDHKTEKLN
jgi:two-component system phosphate regulon response regulator OmpR